IHISTQFRGTVDVRDGDVLLPSFQARLGNTNLTAHATIAGSPRKTVTLMVAEGKGEIQDLMLMFSKASQPSVKGPIVFHTQVVLPPEHRPFKERVQLTGDFNVDPARFPAADTQGSIDQLSERAEGKKDKQKDFDQDDDATGFERVLTQLKGQVRLRNGVATFSRISFSLPGAHADMMGTYSLIDKRVDLRGKMRMQATVSQATTGKKSFFLKVIDPFYKKKGAGAELPVTMSGTYGHTHFAASLK
ncbi:MAG: AsmA-like C-terminal region-containing protein, partial [Candidatus Angelobacter sp.]